MAQKVQVLLLDDLTGGDADETVTFGLDGKTYEIDLNDKNAQKLRKFLTPYVEAGRKTGGKAPAGSRKAKASRSETEPSSEVYRKWAASNGFEVSARGRVPQHVKEAYAAANK
ncbi:histone-like nucleoid-structuring protein Lsr2 [Streptomyces bluensis]|uniref:histone-like nucleoid-structuring protein Lsr2 n=1 Tax=Streptomyces bluensis TaxID=33897 RepID=UPI00332389E9